MLERQTVLEVLLRDGTRLDAYTKGILRGILADAEMTGDRLARNGSIVTDVCRFCDTGAVESHQHMWWICPAWRRGRMPGTLRRARHTTPRDPRACGAAA